MSTSNFTVTEHTSPCSYIRQFPHGAKRDDAVLQLAVKEYRPGQSNASSKGSATIIAAHGNGFPKVNFKSRKCEKKCSKLGQECFEPLWDDLLSAASEFSIDSIWAADMVNQGASYALNSEELGDDPSWIDHSLDLLVMINKFRSKMKPPFIGIGHSMGCAQM